MTVIRTVPARDAGYQFIQYLRLPIALGDATVSAGVLPAGAIIHPAISGVVVSEAWDSGTSDELSIGLAGDLDAFAVDLDISTAGFIPLNGVGPFVLAADTEVIATIVSDGAAATEGEGVIVIAFIPPN